MVPSEARKWELSRYPVYSGENDHWDDFPVTLFGIILGMIFSSYLVFSSYFGMILGRIASFPVIQWLFLVPVRGGVGSI